MLKELPPNSWMKVINIGIKTQEIPWDWKYNKEIDSCTINVN